MGEVSHTRDDQESRFTRDLFPSYAFLPDGKEVVYNQDGRSGG